MGEKKELNGWSCVRHCRGTQCGGRKRTTRKQKNPLGYFIHLAGRTFTLLLLTGVLSYAQKPLPYSDRGHWIGGRIGLFASPNDISQSWTGIVVYEYRFAQNWSVPLEVLRFNKAGEKLFLLNCGMRLRIPLSYPARNVYGQAGISGGYFVFYGAIGFEYGFNDDVSLFTQWKTYTPNFDTVKPHYWLISIGVNYNITPQKNRESYLLE